jgi:hypothetical protein
VSNGNWEHLVLHPVSQVHERQGAEHKLTLHMGRTEPSEDYAIEVTGTVVIPSGETLTVTTVWELA